MGKAKSARFCASAKKKSQFIIRSTHQRAAPPHSAQRYAELSFAQLDSSVTYFDQGAKSEGFCRGTLAFLEGSLAFLDPSMGKAKKRSLLRERSARIAFPVLLSLLDPSNCTNVYRENCTYLTKTFSRGFLTSRAQSGIMLARFNMALRYAVIPMNRGYEA